MCPFLSAPSPKQTLSYYLSLDLPIQDIAFRWTHSTLAFCLFVLCLASFTQHMVSRSTHVEAYIRTSFCRSAKWHSIAWLCHIHLFILPFVDLGCLHFLFLMSNAALNIHGQMFVQTRITSSPGYTPESKIAQSYGDSMFGLLRNGWDVFKSGCVIFKSSWPL